MLDCGYLEPVYHATGGRKGSRVVDVNKLKQALKDDTVMSYSPRCERRSVTIQFLHKVYKWYIGTKPQYKKY